MKIKIERPDAESAIDIFSKYLTEALPIHPDDIAEFDGDRAACVRAMIERVVDRMYAERGQPVLGGHLRQRRQGRSCTSGTSTPVR